ncbi:MFS transporter [Streptomyces sp. AJS327]|nr:MFS transporter [Streptomyces sp. AJS327]
MLAIGIVLLVEHTTGSFGVAGAVSATSGISMALIAPRVGRLADRYGQAAVLVPGAVLHAALVGLLITVALREAPLWVLFAAAVPAGASTPQISPMVRARWTSLLTSPAGGESAPRTRSSLLTTAAAFESVTDEFTFVIGPVLATALSTGLHPAAGLGTEAVLTLGGALVFAAQRRTQPVPSGPHPARRGTARFRGALPRRAARVPRPGAAPGADRGGTSGLPSGTDSPGGRSTDSAWSAPGLRVLVAATLGIGTVFGGMQVSLAAFTQSIGQPELNGVMYGVFAGGNMLAALAVGAVRWRRTARWRLLCSYPTLALAALLLAGTAQLLPWGWLLGGLGLLTGLCIAPSMITSFTLVETLVPATARTEAFTWLTGAIALGQAAGSTLAGQLTDRGGATTGFLAPLVGSGLALVVLLLFRSRLSPGPSRVNGVRAVGHRMPVPVD